ncbi:MAG: phosphotransferase [Blastocatellia bacterium]|nr:phosphotransferase [Blastocatellia bacterium]
MKEFAAFTDAEQMRAIFQDNLPGCARGPFKIVGCKVMHTSLKTFLKEQSRRKSHLSALYRLELVDAANGRKLEQLLYAKTYLDHRSRAEFLRNLNARHSETKFHVSLAHLPELDTVVWCFPNDPALPLLADAVNPDLAIRHLPYELLPEAWNAQEKIRDLRVEIVNYRPEIRCLAKYHLTSAVTGESAPLFGKTYGDGLGEAIHQRMVALREGAGEERPEAFRIARPLGYKPSTRTVWMEALTGASLIERVLGGREAGLMHRTAAGLVAFQQASLTIANRATQAAHLEEAEKKTAKLEGSFPERARPVRDLLRRLQETAASFPPSTETLLHGDFHIDQLRVCGDRLALFDFDELCLGNPLQDVANFLADLHARDLDPALTESLSKEFLAAYQALAPWEVSAERLHWFFSLQLLTKAYRAYWQQKDNLETIIERCVAQADRGLSFAPRGGRR